MTDQSGPGSDLVELRAIKLVGGGRAIAHGGGSTWMVRGGLPGELLRVRPTRRRAGVVEADAVDVVADPHPARLTDPCPHAGECGGCDWPHVDAGLGAALKIEVAAEAAARFPGIAEQLRAAGVTSSPPGYRLRTRLHWDPDRRTLGFYGHRSWLVSPIDHCRIISPTLARRLPRLADALATAATPTADVEVIEGDDAAVAALRPARGGTPSIAADAVPAPFDALGLDGFHRLGPRSRLRRGWGRTAVCFELPVPLEVPIGSFFQGNRHLVDRLFDRVGALVGPGDAPVVDLHGGVGLLAAAARAAGRHDLTVVERHEPSAGAARANLPGARVVASSAEAFVRDLRTLPPDAVVITDPPRSGMTAELRRGLVCWRPARLVMLGCDPATWSRDAADLIGHGYTLSHVELVDLFPFTHHVEVLAVLERG